MKEEDGFGGMMSERDEQEEKEKEKEKAKKQHAGQGWITGAPMELGKRKRKMPSHMQLYEDPNLIDSGKGNRGGKQGRGRRR